GGKCADRFIERARAQISDIGHAGSRRLPDRRPFGLVAHLAQTLAQTLAHTLSQALQIRESTGLKRIGTASGARFKWHAPMRRACYDRGAFRQSAPIGNRMQTFTARLFLGVFLGVLLGVFPGAVLLAMLCGPQPASAQPMPAPARPAVASTPRGASCHGGMTFDRFLADLKAQAVAAGVSQQAIAEASPYLVYDQGIVNRD